MVAKPKSKIPDFIGILFLLHAVALLFPYPFRAQLPPFSTILSLLAGGLILAANHIKATKLQTKTNLFRFAAAFSAARAIFGLGFGVFFELWYGIAGMFEVPQLLLSRLTWLFFLAALVISAKNLNKSFDEHGVSKSLMMILGLLALLTVMGFSVFSSLSWEIA
ncbi:hypothetical protein HYU16_02450 [Candidatus Woesearchaeota archaeon]|nr:hypothetical protein [Candidatus Woesearchaeota archaeon]